MTIDVRPYFIGSNLGASLEKHAFDKAKQQLPKSMKSYLVVGQIFSKKRDGSNELHGTSKKFSNRVAGAFFAWVESIRVKIQTILKALLNNEMNLAFSFMNMPSGSCG